MGLGQRSQRRQLWAVLARFDQAADARADAPRDLELLGAEARAGTEQPRLLEPSPRDFRVRQQVGPVLEVDRVHECLYEQQRTRRGLRLLVGVGIPGGQRRHCLSFYLSVTVKII